MNREYPPYLPRRYQPTEKAQEADAMAYSHFFTFPFLNGVILFLSFPFTLPRCILVELPVHIDSFGPDLLCPDLQPDLVCPIVRIRERRNPPTDRAIEESKTENKPTYLPTYHALKSKDLKLYIPIPQPNRILSLSTTKPRSSILAMARCSVCAAPHHFISFQSSSSQENPNRPTPKPSSLHFTPPSSPPSRAEPSSSLRLASPRLATFDKFKFEMDPRFGSLLAPADVRGRMTARR